MNSNKTKRSIINAIFSLLYIAINGLLGLVYIRLVLKYFGSDYNGINSSATQMVNILLVLEGGFTLATNVALFAPLKENNYASINSILSATKKRFSLIGLLFLLFGFATSFIYAFFIKSEVEYYKIVYLFLMSVIPAGINLIVAIKYKSLLMSDQKEYVISIVSLVTISLGYLSTFLLISLGCGFWAIKIGTFVFSIINSLVIVFITKRQYRFINLSCKPDYGSIKGTKDVFIGKIAGALYTALPILVISIFFGDGSKLVSLYAIYASIFSLLSNAITAFTSAPRFAFGALFTDGNKEKIKTKFLEYEFITFFVVSTLIGTAMTLIISFVTIYTRGINDYNYVDFIIPIVLSTTYFVSSIHIPSGHMINMSGNFKASRNINLVSLIVLLGSTIVSLVLSHLFNWNIYGILISVTIATIFLAIMEFWYAHHFVINVSFLKTLKLLFPSICVFLLSIFLGLWLPSTGVISNYFLFAIFGFVFIFGFALILCLLNLVVNKSQFVSSARMILAFFRRGGAK